MCGFPLFFFPLLAWTSERAFPVGGSLACETLQFIAWWCTIEQALEIDSRIIRIRNIIILQFVEHKHDVWWTISQFRPTFLLIYIAESKRKKKKSRKSSNDGEDGEGEREMEKVILHQQQDFSISHETSNFLYKMKSFSENMKNMISK